jgi:hypothetical protein
VRSGRQRKDDHKEHNDDFKFVKVVHRGQGFAG